MENPRTSDVFFEMVIYIYIYIYIYISYVMLNIVKWIKMTEGEVPHLHFHLRIKVLAFAMQNSLLVYTRLTCRDPHKSTQQAKNNWGELIHEEPRVSPPSMK